MTSANAQLYRDAIGALNRGDVDGFTAVVAPEFEFVTAGLVPGTRRHYVGAEGLRDFYRTFVEEPWSELTVSIERIEDLSQDRIVALITFHGVGSESGIPVEMPYGHIAAFSQGRAVRLDGFASWEEALAAAGVEG